MFPAQPMDPKRATARSATLLQILKKTNLMAELTPLGQQLFGIAKAEDVQQDNDGNANQDTNKSKDKEDKKEFKKKPRVQGGWAAKN
jgi:hypothetical protein